MQRFAVASIMIMIRTNQSVQFSNAFLSTSMRVLSRGYRSASRSRVMSSRRVKTSLSPSLAVFINSGRHLSAHDGVSTRLKSTTSSSSSVTVADLDKQKTIVQDMLYRIRECNHVPEEVQKDLLDFVVESKKVGKMTGKVAKLLCNSSPPESDPVFEIIEISGGNSICSLTKAAGDTLEARTDAVMSVMENLRSKGIIEGWRDELLPLSSGFYDESVLLVERAAAPFLGMQQYGVHINGVVKTDSGEEMMWIARRSKTKSKYPGMLDHIVAGGQPAGLGLFENVLKECAEEAGVPEDITLKGIQAVGAVSYEVFEPSSSLGNDCIDGVISRSLLFNYDLELPQDFKPMVVDGEVEEFFLWTIDSIIESMAEDYNDPIKPNCYLVIIDFLLRKGYLSPEIPGYLDVLRELRGGYCG